MALKIWAHAPFFYYDMDRPYRDLVHEMIDIAQAAEDLGYEGITFPENMFQNYITLPSALQFATAVAVKTKRLKILPGVIVLPQHHPMRIASEVAFADHLAEGRLSIAVARGGGRYQMDRTGIDPQHMRAMYEEALPLLKRIWTEDNISYEGEFYSFPETTIVPKPYTQPHPDIWIAAQSTDGVRKVAELGHNLLTSPNHGDFEPHGDIESLMETYNAAAVEFGNPRGDVMALRHVFLHEDEDVALQKLDKVIHHWNHYMAGLSNATTTQADRLAARVDNEAYFVDRGRVIPAKHEPERDDVYGRYDDPILTTPEKAIARFKHYEEIGIDHVTAMTQMGFEPGEVIHSMELMAKHVFPEFGQAQPEPS